MGLVDRTNVFCESAVFTAAGISDTLDLGPATLRVTAVAGLYLTLEVRTAATDGASEDNTITFSMESDSVAALNSSPTVHWKSEAIIVSALTAGTLVASIPMPTKANYERHLGIRFTILDAAGEVAVNESGSFTAYLSGDPKLKTVYPNAI